MMAGSPSIGERSAECSESSSSSSSSEPSSESSEDSLQSKRKCLETWLKASVRNDNILHRRQLRRLRLRYPHQLPLQRRYLSSCRIQGHRHLRLPNRSASWSTRISLVRSSRDVIT